MNFLSWSLLCPSQVSSFRFKLRCTYGKVRKDWKRTFNFSDNDYHNLHGVECFLSSNHILILIFSMALVFILVELLRWIKVGFILASHFPSPPCSSSLPRCSMYKCSNRTCISGSCCASRIKLQSTLWGTYWSIKVWGEANGIFAKCWCEWSYCSLD